jgi:hypothetical protein
MLLSAAVPKERMIGIQIGATSFFDEGINKVLDSLQENGQVNTLFWFPLAMTPLPVVVEAYTQATEKKGEMLVG